jgi:hypothetical protein
MGSVGMFRVLRHLARTGHLPAPEVAGATHGADLGVRTAAATDSTQPGPEVREPVTV